MKVLSLKNVSKTIGSRLIVDNLNMLVEAGEVYGFLGPNGAGKTTTIRMVVGLIKLSKGKIHIADHDVQSERSKALSHVGAIVENPEMYPYLSGQKNLIHYARLAGISRQERPKRIEEVVKLVELKDRIHDKVKTYSLGMRQRLGLAQALLGSPKLLVLDEPTNGLDPSGMREFRELMRRVASTGVAVFVSSHLLSEIQLMCDRVAMIKNGRIVTEQNVSSLLNQAAHSVIIRLKDSQKALSLLKEQGWEVTSVDDQSIQADVNAESVPLLVRTLVEESIDIYAVEPVKDSLEDRFIEMMKDEEEPVAVGTGGHAHE